MKTSARIITVLSVALVLVSASGCSKLRSRDQLNKGVQAYKAGRQEEAIDHFKQAVEFDPSYVNARLYLATAYASIFVPGIDSEENNRNAEAAIDQFKKVLELQPKNINSLKGIASIYYNQGNPQSAKSSAAALEKLDQAKEYHRKALQIDPKDAEEYYSIGVIDWSEAYLQAAQMKAAKGLKVDDEIKDKALCEQVKAKNEAIIQDGIDSLNDALKQRADYEDAMAYINLIYRRKADIECGDPGARQADIKTADDWVQKNMDTRKAKAERLANQPAGVVQEPAQ